jgi:hypothetical protein
MRNAKSPRSYTLMSSLAVATLLSTGAPIFAQEPPAVSVSGTQVTGFPDDWSHHHVVFSNPGTEQEAIQGGRQAEWQKVVNDPRYVLQQLRRNSPVQGPAATDAEYRARWVSEASPRSAASGTPGIGLPTSGLNGGLSGHSLRPIRGGGVRQNRANNGGVNSDWNESVGTTTNSTAINYPAKWNLATASASCTSDFVIYPTGQAGISTQASIISYYNLYSSCVGGTVPSVDWAYYTGGTISLAPTFSLNGNQVAFVQTTGSGSVTATTASGSKTFTVTTGTINSSEVGSLITGTGIPTGDTIAGVSGTTGTLTTAAGAGSGTGTALTIIGVAQLVLLTYPLTPPGTGVLGTPIAPTAETNTAYYNGGTGCTAPCSFTATLNGSPADTWSSPYIDYASDTLYVGDAVGKLHKFTPVFKGAPAEVITAPWPVQMAHGTPTVTNDTNQLASPVYDSTSGNVFVGSTTSVSTTTGGFFYGVTASTGLIHGYSSTQIDKQYGVRDAPLLDPTAGEVYAFSGDNPAGDSAVYQFPTNFTSATTLVDETTGAGATSDDAYVFSGALDNTYYTSSNSASPTGNLYVCASGLGGTLYQIPITANVMGTPVAGPTLTDAGHYGRCSEFTEFLNSNATIAATAATGTATVASSPSGGGWTGAAPTVTIGATAYTFVTGTPAANQVVKVTTGGSPTTREQETAQNFEAVINNTSSECATAGCVAAAQVANASATASYTAGTTVVNLTATTTGTAGDFTLTTSTAGDVAVSGGSNGANAVSGPDLLFFSNFAGTQGTCTNDTADGCVMSFNITTPSSFGVGTTPLGTLNIASQNLTTASATNPAAVTSGIVVDNSATTGGASEIYFLTQDNSGATACVTGGADGICAIQASQTAP